MKNRRTLQLLLLVPALLLLANPLWGYSACSSPCCSTNSSTPQNQYPGKVTGEGQKHDCCKPDRSRPESYNCRCAPEQAVTEDFVILQPSNHKSVMTSSLSATTCAAHDMSRGEAIHSHSGIGPPPQSVYLSLSSLRC